MDRLYKYPRTHHLTGSGLQRGDEDLKVVPYTALIGRYIVVEEKMDGANCGISFSSDGELRLQSRGHYLTGGARERQFHLLKGWAGRYAAELWELLGDRYILYGEWLYAKHTIFYTDLPHYLMEFDIYDKQSNTFLSTEQRRMFLQGAPFIVSVKVLYEGIMPLFTRLKRMVGDSHFIAADHLDQLQEAAREEGLNPGQVLRETDRSRLMEGLYIKVEEDGIVTERYKYVRADFLQTILDSNSHWMSRPLLPNRLCKGVNLF